MGIIITKVEKEYINLHIIHYEKNTIISYFTFFVDLNARIRTDSSEYRHVN